MTEKLLLTFPSVHYAMKAEKALIGEGYETKMIPTPRDISTSCGLCLLLSVDLLERVETGEPKLEIERLYVYDKEKGKSIERPARG